MSGIGADQAIRLALNDACIRPNRTQAQTATHHHRVDTSSHNLHSATAPHTHLHKTVALLALGHVDVISHKPCQRSRETCVVQQANCHRGVELVPVVCPLIVVVWPTHEAAWQLVVVGVCGSGCGGWRSTTTHTCRLVSRELSGPKHCAASVLFDLSGARRQAPIEKHAAT